MSTCLDPRFMLVTFVQEKIVEEGKIIARRLEEEIPPQLPESTEPSQQQKNSLDPPNKKRKLVDILSKVMTSRNEVLNNEERVQEELIRYLQCPQPEVKSSPLEWWKGQQKNFPILSHLAKKYLSVCATSSPSERVFSASGNIINSKRTYLNPDNVDKLVFLAKNL